MRKCGYNLSIPRIPSRDRTSPHWPPWRRACQRSSLWREGMRQHCPKRMANTFRIATTAKHTFWVRSGSRTRVLDSLS